MIRRERRNGYRGRKGVDAEGEMRGDEYRGIEGMDTEEGRA